MYSAQPKHRVTTAIAGLLIAGSGLAVATSAYAADPQPVTGAGTGTASSPAAPVQGSAPAQGTASAPGSTGQDGQSGQAGQSAQAAAEPLGRVVSKLPLSIRAAATSDSSYLGSLQPGATITLHCKVLGQNVEGNNRWYRLGNGRAGYVTARYVENLSPVPWCG